MNRIGNFIEKHKELCSIVTIMIGMILIIILVALSACNVTRTVTTKAEYYQRGDTTVQIVTRTTESYDGSVKPENLLKH